MSRARSGGISHLPCTGTGTGTGARPGGAWDDNNSQPPSDGSYKDARPRNLPKPTFPFPRQSSFPSTSPLQTTIWNGDDTRTHEYGSLQLVHLLQGAVHPQHYPATDLGSQHPHHAAAHQPGCPYHPTHCDGATSTTPHPTTIVCQHRALN